MIFRIEMPTEHNLNMEIFADDNDTLLGRLNAEYSETLTAPKTGIGSSIWTVRSEFGETVRNERTAVYTTTGLVAYCMQLFAPAIAEYVAEKPLPALEGNISTLKSWSREGLMTFMEANGIDFDRRWGMEKLRAVVNAWTEGQNNED